MNILELMQKYNMTLRHLPDKVTSFYSDRGQSLKENEERVMWKQRDGSDWPMIKETRFRKKSKEWLAIVDRTWNNTQNWGGAFEGDTAEEAIMKAVNHINNKSND